MTDSIAGPAVADGARAPYGIQLGSPRWWGWFAPIALGFGGLLGLAMWALVWRSGGISPLLPCAVAGVAFALFILREARPVRVVVDAGDPSTIKARFYAVATGLKWSPTSVGDGVECNARWKPFSGMSFALDLCIRDDALAEKTRPKAHIQYIVRKLGGRVLGPA